MNVGQVVRMALELKNTLLSNEADEHVDEWSDEAAFAKDWKRFC